jgi:uncharacterized protein (TIGR02118 family)
VFKVISILDASALDDHAATALALPQVRAYAQAQRIGDAGTARFDGYASTWFDDVPAAQAAAPALAERAIAQVVTEELVQRDTPAGPAMVKLIFVFHRKPGMAPEAFRRHWLEVHGPLAMTHIANLRRYVQNHTIDDEYAVGEPAFDGLVEAWLDDAAALEETEASSEHEFVRSDEPNFLDTDRVTFMPVSERRLR